jgi:DNA-binding winged helix-turn-helix (wHTH) protein/tetratricopeptide (TPR) repeat protein
MAVGMRFGEYELDLARFELKRRGMRVRVQPKVLDLLVYLIRHRERVVPKDELLAAVWQGVMVSETALNQAVKEARRAVRDDGQRQAVIQTVRGRGYRFVAVVEEPEEPAGVATGPFVGRGSVLQLLAQELEAARGGHGRVVFITGEPGIGKSRTVLEFAAAVQRRGARALMARCLEGQGAPAHWPWTQIVRGAVRQGLMHRRDLTPETAAVLVQALPDLRAELSGGQPLREPVSPSDEQGRFRLSDELTRLLQKIGESQPLVLVLDDLQWADISSLHLLEFLMRDAGQAPILLIGTYREAELSRQPTHAQVLGSVARLPGARTVPLEGLTCPDVAELFEVATGRALPVTLAESIQRRTGGNPFFVTQIIQLWEATPGSDLEDLRKELPLPQGMREAIGRHLDVLHESARDLLTRAAVIGREFDLDVLAHVSGVSVDAALDTLGNGIDVRVVRPVGESWTRFEFSHALIPETLYEAMSTARRLRLHARVGRALEELRGDDPSRAAEIAHQFAQAAPMGHAEEALRYAIKAAEVATGQLAYEESVVHYERALEVSRLTPQDDAGRLSLLLALGEAQARMGEVSAARKTFQLAAGLARELGDAEGLARAALSLDWDIVRQGSVGTDAVRLALLGEALGAVGPSESPLRVRLLAALDEALYFEDDPAPGPSLSRAAVEMARRLDDPDALVFALNRRHMLLRRPESLDERLAVSTELVQLAKRRRDPDLVFDAYGSQIHDALEHGDIRVVDEAFETFDRLAEETRIPKYLWYAGLYGAMRDLLAGRFAEAESRIASSYEMGQRVQPDLARLWYVVQMQALRLDQGREAEFLPELRSVAELYPIDVMQLNLAFVEGATGFTGPARRVRERVVREGVRKLRRDITWIFSMTTLARLAEILGDAELASVVYPELLPFERQTVVVGTAIVYQGSVAHELGRLAGVLGNWAEAGAHFETALRRERSMGAPPRQAAVLCGWGRMLLARGDAAGHAEARERLAQAAEVAAKVGAVRNHQLALELKKRAES